jgi:hypothetical protein
MVAQPGTGVRCTCLVGQVAATGLSGDAQHQLAQLRSRAVRLGEQCLDLGVAQRPQRHICHIGQLLPDAPNSSGRRVGELLH